MKIHAFALYAIAFLFPLSLIADDKAPLTNSRPLSPREELATFRTLKGFKVELVACEPDVVDPVALAFDDDGRLYVVEMRGYPNEGVGTGKVTSGRIKLLEDCDGDGFFEKSTVFADGLRLPTGVMPYRGGVLVCNAPDIVFMEDTNGDGRADRQRVLYSGFNLSNIQQMINSVQWGLDNWVYGCAGLNGGTVRSAEKADAPPVELRGRGIRFHPDVPASLEPTSGGGQFGLAADDWGHWFTATNSQHLRQIVLPDHYLRRNPFLPVRAVTLDVPDHGAACKVHRISPFEAWRVERTTRRKGSPEAKNFSTTELVPGGFITSACSPLVYNATAFPNQYRGNTLVCDPANNLIHRDVLVPQGAVFVAKRADSDCEFLASTDNWFRPVNLVLGPEGAVYVADFYREVIETPLSLPDDIKKRLNLESRGRGRIWRIVPEAGVRNVRPELRKAASATLVQHLSSPNPWWRLTAQRLLVERQDKSVVAALRDMAGDYASPQGGVHALWTLQGLGALTDGELRCALGDEDPGFLENALRLAEPRLSRSERLRKATAALVNDPSPHVRLQLAFTLGAAEAPELAAAWAELARRDAGDYWFQTALLSSANKTAPAYLERLVQIKEFTGDDPGRARFLTSLAALVGARADDAGLARALSLLRGKASRKPVRWQAAVLEGLGQGLQNSQRSLERLWESKSPGLKAALEGTKVFFADAARVSGDDKQALGDRLAAVRLLALGPPVLSAKSLPPLLAPQEPRELQLAAVRALSVQAGAQVPDILLSSWGSYSPVVRREVLEALFARAERLPKLLDAIAAKKVLASQLEPARLTQLRKHTNAAIRKQAANVLAGQIAPDRQKVVLAYQPALALKGDAGKGKLVFQKTCSTCHRLENVGQEVGADLQSALRNKTPEALLVDILDPSREVDPRYIEYLVTTRSGKVVTGLIAAETASSVTLRRAEKAEDTVLRNQIESVQATAKSLMPEGLEMQLDRQALADLIAYLQAIGTKR
jgi:putative membrane-bound dehydrogenase-like protein